MRWADSSYLVSVSLHSRQQMTWAPFSFLNFIGRLAPVFLCLCLYKQCLQLNFISQCLHWNLLRTLRLRGRTEPAVSVGEESVALFAGEVGGCVEAWAEAPVLGDAWPVVSLFSEGLACVSLFCVEPVGSGHVNGWGFSALAAWSTEKSVTFWGFREVDGVSAKDLFLHDEGTARGHLAEEHVFGGGDNFSSKDNGWLTLKEEPLETWVLVTEASAGAGGK